MPLKVAITITFCQLLLTDAREVILVQLKLLGLTIPEESERAGRRAQVPLR
jgi:hypothetical protein